MFDNTLQLWHLPSSPVLIEEVDVKEIEFLGPVPRHESWWPSSDDSEIAYLYDFTQDPLCLRVHRTNSIYSRVLHDIKDGFNLDFSLGKLLPLRVHILLLAQDGSLFQKQSNSYYIPADCISSFSDFLTHTIQEDSASTEVQSLHYLGLSYTGIFGFRGVDLIVLGSINRVNDHDVLLFEQSTQPGALLKDVAQLYEQGQGLSGTQLLALSAFIHGTFSTSDRSTLIRRIQYVTGKQILFSKDLDY